MSKNFVKKGFTLIELLIVVVILGILATVVIAALNPVEAINKSRDTALKNDLGTFATAIDSYYATYRQFPWQRVVPAVTLTAIGTANTTPVNNAGTVPTWLNGHANSLVGTAEVRSDYHSRASFRDIFINNTNDVYKVCFAPTSRAFLAEARYDNTGTVVATGATRICLPD